MIKKAAAVEEIKKSSGNDKVEAMKLDLASLQSVRDFSKEFKSRGIPIHVLVNNAGVMAPSLQKSADGYELTFAVNHLGHFLLTNLLLDNVKQVKGRIVNVSSSLHKNGVMDFDNLNGEKKWSSSSAYSTSKLANVLFTNELQKRVSGTGVDCFSLHPGFVATEFGRDLHGAMKFFLGVAKTLFAIKVEDGAKTSIFTASSPTLDGKGGAYLDESKIVEPNKKATSVEDAKKLWELSEKLVNLSSSS
jgi:NAD(P)-dependent dehydrogenase (short-subunit alcohol dehydrogenase family)